MKKFACFFLLLCLLSAMPLMFAEEPQNPAVMMEPALYVERYQQQCERMEQGNVDLLMVGDSITHGWDTVGKEVWDKYYGHRQAMNFGIGADRTGHVLWRIEHSPMEKISPKMVVIMIGTNNLGASISTPEQAVEGIALIVDKFRILYPEAKILLLKVFPRDATPSEPLRQGVARINDGLEILYADDQVYNVKLLDLWSLFLTKEGIYPAEISPDFLHPNAKGYEIWAAAMEPYIVDALGETIPAVVGTERTEESWQERFKEKRDRIAQGDVDFLMIGDSIPHYWETTGKEQWDKYYGDKKAVNLGIGSDRTDHVIWRLEHYPMDRIHPKGAVIIVGGNNFTAGHQPHEAALGIRKIVLMLKEWYPDIKIVVLKDFPWGEPGENVFRPKFEALNLALEPMMLGLDNVQVLDLGPKLLDLQGNLTPVMMPDFVHPSPLGYEIWGNAMDAIVRDMLK